MKEIDTAFVKKVLGKNIKFYRLQNKISQEELAEKTNSSPAYISNVECGRVSISPKKLAKFRNVLGVTLSDLYNEDIIHTKIPNRITEYNKF